MFSVNFYKGRGRLREEIFSAQRGRGGGWGCEKGGVMEGGGSVCPLVSVSQNVFRPCVETVDETLHLFGQLGFARDRGEVPNVGGLIKV